jgi:hypothetical protein
LVSLGRRYWWTDSFSLTENGRCSTIALRGIANIVQYIPSQQTLTGNQRNTHTKEPTPQEPVSAETKRNKTKQIREAPANLPCTRELDQDHRPQPKAIEGQPRPGNKLPGNIDGETRRRRSGALEKQAASYYPSRTHLQQSQGEKGKT